jgi:hypothetical protein
MEEIDELLLVLFFGNLVFVADADVAVVADEVFGHGFELLFNLKPCQG